jgi:hypothetical protein
MKANFLFLIFSIFMLQNIFALDNYWTQRFNDQSLFKYDIKARLRKLSIHELRNMIERVNAFELRRKLEKERQNRAREEKRIKQEREGMERLTKIKPIIDSHFGSSKFLIDFFKNIM